MTIDDIYKKLEELNDKLDNLKNIDYDAKNIINSGNLVTTPNNDDLTIEFAKNAKTLGGLTYDDFVADIKDYLTPVIDDIKNSLKEQNAKIGVGANFVKEWFNFEIDDTKDVIISSVATLESSPSYVSILFKLGKCSEKNGGSDGLITQIPPIGVAIDGLPFSKNINDLKNYSGWWFEGGQLKVFLKKANFQKWLGNCKDIQCKVYAWY